MKATIWPEKGWQNYKNEKKTIHLFVFKKNCVCFFLPFSPKTASKIRDNTKAVVRT